MRLQPHNVSLAGVRDDVMLLSYLVNPTHGSHTLPDIAARTTSRGFVHQPTKNNPNDPKRLAEAAAAVARLASALGVQVAEAGTVEHQIPKDDPALGGAVTAEMLFAGRTRSHSRIVPGLQCAAGGCSDETIELNKPLVPVLLRMEQAGVRIDPGSWRDVDTSGG